VIFNAFRLPDRLRPRASPIGTGARRQDDTSIGGRGRGRTSRHPKSGFVRAEATAGRRSPKAMVNLGGAPQADTPEQNQHDF
jgi:hypothetical protein